MIAVQRTPAPRVLERNAARWLAELQTVLSLPAPTKEQIVRAQNRYRHKGVKQALVAMFHGIRGRRELIDHRSRYVKRLFALLRFAQQGDAEAAALLREALQPDAEYCAFARVYIQPHLA